MLFGLPTRHATSNMMIDKIGIDFACCDTCVTFRTLTIFNITSRISSWYIPLQALRCSPLPLPYTLR